MYSPTGSSRSSRGLSGCSAANSPRGRSRPGGVCRYLRDRAESARCEHIRAVTHHVELNASAEFMEQYIMNMNFNVL